MSVLDNVINNVAQTPTFLTTFPSPTVLESIPSLINVYNGVATDSVKVMDGAAKIQVFQRARAMKINVSPSAKLMDHPIENGATRTDFRIINPLEIELSVICTGSDYQSVYQEIKAAWLAGNLYTVVSKADSYFNMMISAIPHDETPDMYDVIVLAVKMREVIQVETQYQPLPAKRVRHTNDQSTVNSGAVTPATPPPSLLAQGVDALKSLIH
jgi:hypothetical protein